MREVDHPAADDPRMPLVHLLRAVTVELGLVSDRFATLHGLHPTDLRALIHLLDAERAGITATPGRLGDRLAMGSSAVTALVDRLVRLGLVRRAADPDDRRRVLLEVDDAAVALGWSFFGPLINRIVEASDGFTPSELHTVERFLTAVRDAIAAEPPHDA
ncbi:MarR family transcriptional regulator [Actinocorallia sp. B10E7]|uniref:MarR family winged helix-turn-helix transcriptional regulator n=1 Tax=Actinocorallia sp. B10E7 TaxID=3153558 RepID=UPI00325F2285